MKTEEAKIILASVHRESDRTSDADISEAFALLDSDPELQDWFEQEQAFDAAITNKLAEIEPPADLKAKLVGLLDENTAPESSDIARVHWLRSPLLAAAAAVALVSFFTIQLFTGPAKAGSFDSFRSDMVEIAHGGLKLDHHEKDLDRLYDWLNKVGATCPDELPVCVECTETVGCKIIDWNDDKVTLICLRNNSSQVVHCFVIPREQFDQLPDEAQIRNNLLMDGLDTTAWSDQELVYLLVGSKEGVKVTSPAL